MDSTLSGFLMSKELFYHVDSMCFSHKEMVSLMIDVLPQSNFIAQISKVAFDFLMIVTFFSYSLMG